MLNTRNEQIDSSTVRVYEIFICISPMGIVFLFSPSPQHVYVCKRNYAHQNFALDSVFLHIFHILWFLFFFYSMLLSNITKALKFYGNFRFGHRGRWMEICIFNRGAQTIRSNSNDQNREFGRKKKQTNHAISLPSFLHAAFCSKNSFTVLTE